MHILSITTDHQQWRTIAGRSACRTPNLQRLVDTGVTFNRCGDPYGDRGFGDKESDHPNHYGAPRCLPGEQRVTREAEGTEKNVLMRGFYEGHQGGGTMTANLEDARARIEDSGYSQPGYAARYDATRPPIPAGTSNSVGPRGAPAEDASLETARCQALKE